MVPDDSASEDEHAAGFGGLDSPTMKENKQHTHKKAHKGEPASEDEEDCAGFGGLDIDAVLDDFGAGFTNAASGQSFILPSRPFFIKMAQNLDL